MDQQPGVPAPVTLPAPDAVLARAGHENFPVALRLLPAGERAHLMAVYGFARLVDDIGDELAPEDRPAALDWVEAELERALDGRATHPLLVDLGRAATACDLPRQALRDLVAANRLDQVRTVYQTYDQVLGSCELSANPVGRLVLAVFGAATAERVALADDVCTGLQLAEHLQDVGEDARRGRIYLAEEDRLRWGCHEADLRGPTAGPALRGVVATYTARARQLLLSAVPLVASLSGRHRLALAAFAAGGLAALDAVEAAAYDVLGMACRPSPVRRVALAATLAAGRPPPALSLLSSGRRPVLLGSGTADAPVAELAERQVVGDGSTEHQPAHAGWSAGGGDARGPAPLPGTDAVAAAFAACEAITRAEARNFAYGIRLLRPPERQALSTVYALARRIDDIGDGDAPAQQRLVGLARVRSDVADVAAGRPVDPGDPVLVALAAVTERYPLPLDAFDELVTGCEMDVRGTRYDTLDELIGYCRHVAGTIGRLSLGVFGTADPVGGAALADDLGVALQLTNICRDVLEDRAMGRVYLPADMAARHGLDPALEGPPAALAALVGDVAAQADEWYGRGLRLLPLLDGRSRACVAAMAGIYRRLLAHIQADPAAVTRGRLSLPGRTKALVAVRSLAGVPA